MTKLNDNLQQLLDTFYDYFFLQCSNHVKRNTILCKELLDVKTGKQDANFATEDGSYSFFTCSKEVSKCDTAAFNGHAILIAGNGDFNVKHYNGEFNAYQRTYVLIPNDELYFGTLYMSSLKLIKKFKRMSTGSIVKFISKSDIENIQVIVPENKNLLKTLNDYLKVIEKNNLENEHLERLRNKLLPLLINGQVTIR